MSSAPKQSTPRENAGAAVASDVVTFGPYRLFAAQRLIEREGIPLHLGARALDILIVLTEQAGKVVSKHDLMARVWPGLTVDEGSLRVHVASLRKALRRQICDDAVGAGILLRRADHPRECGRALPRHNGQCPISPATCRPA